MVREMLFAFGLGIGCRASRASVWRFGSEAVTHLSFCTMYFIAAPFGKSGGRKSTARNSDGFVSDCAASKDAELQNIDAQITAR